MKGVQYVSYYCISSNASKGIAEILCQRQFLNFALKKY